MWLSLTYNLNSNTFKGNFLAGTSYLSPKVSKVRLGSPALWPHRAGERFLSSWSDCQPPGLRVFAKPLMLPGWVHLSHRNWLPLMLSPFPLLGQTRVTTSLLIFWDLSFPSRPGSIEIAWRFPGHSLTPILYPTRWVHFHLPFLLTTARKGIYPDSVNSKVVPVHRKEESLVLSPWRWVLCTTLYSTSATIFFF